MWWLLGLMSCAPAGDPCTLPAFVDLDGDGFGAESAGFVCAPTLGVAWAEGDCDDEDPGVFPGAAEQCDLIDQDCDGVVDDGFETVAWYPDLDEDGFGDDTAAQEACRSPGPDFLLEGGDCDDGDPDITPSAPEICDGVDNDCDDVVDDEDDDLVLTSRSAFFADLDGDSYGDPASRVDRCEAPPDFVDNDLDCLDTDSTVNPDATAELCDFVDNDCDGLVDDLDTVARSTNDATIESAKSPRTLLHCDFDADGYGDPVQVCLACAPRAGFGVDNALDCDDSDPLATIDQPWLADADGGGTPIVTQCTNPNHDGGIWDPPLVPISNGIDCEWEDGSVYPGAPDPLGDDVDQDCDGVDG